MEISKFARPYEVNQPARCRLVVDQVSLSFGGVTALNNVSLSTIKRPVKSGQLRASLPECAACLSPGRLCQIF